MIGINPGKYSLARRLKVRYVGWRRWVKQGRPTDGPVIVAEGELLKCSNCGARLIRNWWWESNHMKHSISYSDWWDFLAKRYPVKEYHCRGSCEKGKFL